MIFALLFGLFVGVYSKSAVPTVSQLDLPSYLGHWEEVYHAPTNVLFQGYGTCITADYGLLENGNVNVINTQLNKDGAIEQIRGYGYYTNVSDPGKLTVHLEGVPVDSPYWVVKLGENRDGQYQYSIITTPSSVSLWVLARDISTFFEEYNTEVVEFLDEYGFVYTKTVHED